LLFVHCRIPTPPNEGISKSLRALTAFCTSKCEVLVEDASFQGGMHQEGRPAMLTSAVLPGPQRMAKKDKKDKQKQESSLRVSGR
jgi:hypothetical protein